MKKHISPSQIESYTRCGEAYRRRYIEGERIPPGVALVRGSSLHKGAEVNFVQKIRSRQDMRPDDIIGVAVHTFENKVKNEGIWLSPEEQTVGEKKIIGAGKDATVRLTRLFATDLAPRVQPKEVEIEHRIELPNSSHDLLGRLDLVDENDAIDDLKTSAKKACPEDVDKNTQLTFYALTFQNKYKKPPTEIRYSQLVDTKEPQVNVVKTTRTRADFEALVNRINAVIRGVNAGIFTPAMPGSWWCSPKFCGYWATCAYVNNGRKTV